MRYEYDSWNRMKSYTDGSAIQHLHYLPFGEEQIDQRLTGFNSRYTFSAKEKDVETNYSYFGARYYNSELSIWLSVDPMSDKYPSLTPYVYCSNNPIMLVDPNGEDFDPVVDEEKKTITINAVYYAANKNKDRLQEGVDAWNAQSGKYTYTTGEGDEKKTYSVIFNLKVDDGDYKTEQDAQAAVKQDGKSNYFTVGKLRLEDSRGESDGMNIIVRNSAPKRTVTHELGHTLGIGDGIEVMESGGDSGTIINSHVATVLQKAGITSSGSFNGGINISNQAKTTRKYNMNGIFR